MFHGLDTTLKAILDDNSALVLVSNADVTFDRPAENYNPDRTTINLFLYDVRENTEVRNSEPLVEHKNGQVTIRRPPIRMNCSYLVTAWTGPEVTGEVAIFEQHKLLGEVMRLFQGMPTIESRYLQGGLTEQTYPIPLSTIAVDLNKNPAEFWSALGGKLRPSFTLTATIAMEQIVAPVIAPEVTSKIVAVHETGLTGTETLVGIGGTVRNATTLLPIGLVELTLVETGFKVTTNTDGRFTFNNVVPGTYSISAVKNGYNTTTRTALQVPGISPTAFDINLSSL